MCYYVIGISVQDYNPIREQHIMEAASDEWPIDWLAAGGRLEGKGVWQLYPPEDPDDLMRSLFTAIVKANEAPCAITCGWRELKAVRARHHVYTPHQAATVLID